MSTQTLNLTPAVYQYFQAHSCREPEILARLREDTLRQYPESAQMQISPEQGQFMQLLVKMLQGRKILEIGTFTGYSALWMALALPEHGKLITCDINEDTTSFAQKYWGQAKLTAKVTPKLAPAKVTLQELIANGEENSFDLAFIDADKTSYDFYYEQCLLLVRAGGIIAIDNTLQGGKVAETDNLNPNTVALQRLNDKLLCDERIMLSMLPISDGLTLAYNKYRDD